MKNRIIAFAASAAMALGCVAAQAKMPAPPPLSDADKAAAAEKAKLAAATEAELLGKYQDLAVANHKKNKGIVDAPAPASKSGKQ